MNTNSTRVEWGLIYQGVRMMSPIFRSYEECADYIANSPKEQKDDYTIISRVVVERQSDWQVWK